MAKTELVGKVLSDKMEKTVVVAIERLVAHPVYKKRFRKTQKVKAHNEMGAQEGDTVRITESKPLSKDKTFVVSEIVSKKVILETVK